MWGSAEKLQEFLCLRLKYLQHFVSQELSEATSSKKLFAVSVVKAGLKIFAAEKDPKLIHQMAALDTSIPSDSWGKYWSAALEHSSSPDEIIAHLSKSLELDGVQLAKKIDVTKQVQENTGDGAQARQSFVICYISVVSLFVLHFMRELEPQRMMTSGPITERINYLPN